MNALTKPSFETGTVLRSQAEKGQACLVDLPQRPESDSCLVQYMGE